MGVSDTATCYFPEWTNSVLSLSFTVKLIDDVGGFPALHTAYSLSSGLFSTQSNIFQFTTATPIPSFIVSEATNPSIYSPTTEVETIVKDYKLTMSVPILTDKPYIYINFQKGGIIPDVQLCTNTFFLKCRIYTKLIHILIAQYKSTAASTNLVLNSNYIFNTLIPSHIEPGTNDQYRIIAKVINL